KTLEWVAVREFNISNVAPEAIHYDPVTRSFVAYKSNDSKPPLELCLDGTMIEHPDIDGQSNGEICPAGFTFGDPECSVLTYDDPLARPWPFAGNQMDGATYDPFNDTWLFLSRSGLTRVDELDGTGAVSAALTGDGLAIGEDGRLYVVVNHSSANDTIRVYERDSSQSLGFDLSAPITSWVAPAKKPLDTIFGMPGF